jgi:signal transduction histidine kinase
MRSVLPARGGASPARPFQRLVDVATIGRLIVAGLGLILVVLQPFGQLEKRPLTVALIGGVYIPYSLALVLWRHRLLSLWPITAVVDFGTTFLFQLTLPTAHTVVLLGYNFLVVYYATIAGRAAALASTASAVVLTEIARVAGPPEHRIDHYSLIVFAGVLLTAGAMIEAATREQRAIVKREHDFRFASIAHDIRLPLTSIAGLSETLLGRWHELSEEDRGDALAALYRNVGELDEMTQELVEYSTIDQERIVLRPQPVHLAGFVAAFLDQHAPALGAGRVWLAIPGALYASTDPHVLERILGNLIGNAVEYSAPGAAVRVIAEEAGAFVEIHIENETQMSSGELERLFGKGVRPLSPGTRRHGGIGIAIARAYTELQGGTLRFTRTTKGVRATFSVAALAPGEGRRSIGPADAMPA